MHHCKRSVIGSDWRYSTETLDRHYRTASTYCLPIRDRVPGAPDFIHDTLLHFRCQSLYLAYRPVYSHMWYAGRGRSRTTEW